jgi:hypothetical protein
MELAQRRLRERSELRCFQARFLVNCARFL